MGVCAEGSVWGVWGGGVCTEEFEAHSLHYILMHPMYPWALHDTFVYLILLWSVHWAVYDILLTTAPHNIIKYIIPPFLISSLTPFVPGYILQLQIVVLYLLNAGWVVIRWLGTQGNCTQWSLSSGYCAGPSPTPYNRCSREISVYEWAENEWIGAWERNSGRSTGDQTVKAKMRYVSLNKQRALCRICKVLVILLKRVDDHSLTVKAARWCWVCFYEAASSKKYQLETVYVPLKE